MEPRRRADRSQERPDEVAGEVRPLGDRHRDPPAHAGGLEPDLGQLAQDDLDGEARVLSGEGAGQDGLHAAVGD